MPRSEEHRDDMTRLLYDTPRHAGFRIAEDRTIHTDGHECLQR
ncbi:hypothetical protein [Coraliomargarita parva]|nr:hypothetical protein [Coraliomargarita parva]